MRGKLKYIIVTLIMMFPLFSYAANARELTNKVEVVSLDVTETIPDSSKSITTKSIETHSENETTSMETTKETTTEETTKETTTEETTTEKPTKSEFELESMNYQKFMKSSQIVIICFIGVVAGLLVVTLISGNGNNLS